MPAEASGCRTKGSARIPILGVVESAVERDGKYDKNRAVKHPDWKVEATGDDLYKAKVAILRESDRIRRGERSIFEERRRRSVDLRLRMGMKNESPCISIAGF